mmetsp:Transcript_35975/g.66748  ORF Transcript_35975/g.66748 Transcript_35975/m.66748 type:complete len:88 (-) Transcript_35975:1475-1738(-)
MKRWQNASKTLKRWRNAKMLKGCNMTPFQNSKRENQTSPPTNNVNINNGSSRKKGKTSNNVVALSHTWYHDQQYDHIPTLVTLRNRK